MEEYHKNWAEDISDEMKTLNNLVSDPILAYLKLGKAEWLLGIIEECSDCLKLLSENVHGFNDRLRTSNLPEYNHIQDELEKYRSELLDSGD